MSATKREGAKSLQGIAEEKLLDFLGASISDHKSIATFACGGSIPITPTRKLPTLTHAAPSSHPVALRWDSSTSDGVSKVTFPVNDVNEQNLKGLLNDCAPATFGYGGKDILDESYRKAIKLDPSAFSSDLNVYDLGIVDVIAQILLPSAHNAEYLRGVRAELYKLNIYSGPSGRFKAHIDTPRSEAQFGSLVVCLPCDHEGGQLVLRHKKTEIDFDWSINAADLRKKGAINWAAFYSDVEHEVLEVTSGHRVTLTYNLYVTHGPGALAGTALSFDPKQLPLYGIVEEMLRQPAFLSKGGLLGIYCAHAYAHANEHAVKCLPAALKGVDMAVYEVFRALGLTVELRPVIRNPKNDGYNDDDFDVYDEEPDEYGDYEGGRYLDLFGRKLHSVSESQGQWGDHDKLDPIWLNGPGNGDLAINYLAYGNQAELEASYSYAAILVQIPPFFRRMIMQDGVSIDRAGAQDEEVCIGNDSTYYDGIEFNEYG